MHKKMLPQQQLITAKQIVIGLGIVACVVFIVSYSGRVVMDRRVAAQKQHLEQQVKDAGDFQQTLQKRLQNIDDPANVEAYARDEQRWGMEGEHPVAPMIEEAPKINPIGKAIAELDDSKLEEQSNWQQWLGLLTEGGN